MSAAAAGGPASALRRDVHPPDPVFPEVHVASLAEAPNGDLLYAFYGGSAEARPDVALYLARRPAGTQRWEPPVKVYDEPGKAAGNAVLWVDGPTTYLFVSVIMGRRWTDCELRMLSSTDHGATWSAPRTIREEWGWVFGSAPVRMSNGEVLVPIYDERTWRAGWYVTGVPDRGGDPYATWTAYPTDPAAWPTSPRGAIQPATVELGDGRLLTLLRTRDGLVYRTDSRDFGRTWSVPVPTTLPNPNSRVALLGPVDGALVLAYNPLERGRGVLALTVSDDEGYTWSPPVEVERDLSSEFSYPYLVRDRAGRLHLGYTHRRRTMRHLEFDLRFARSGGPMASDDTDGVTEYREGDGGARRDVSASCDIVAQ